MNQLIYFKFQILYLYVPFKCNHNLNGFTSYIYKLYVYITGSIRTKFAETLIQRAHQKYKYKCLCLFCSFMIGWKPDIFTNQKSTQLYTCIAVNTLYIYIHSCVYINSFTFKKTFYFFYYMCTEIAKKNSFLYHCALVFF